MSNLSPKYNAVCVPIYINPSSPFKAFTPTNHQQKIHTLSKNSLNFCLSGFYRSYTTLSGPRKDSLGYQKMESRNPVYVSRSAMRSRLMDQNLNSLLRVLRELNFLNLISESKLMARNFYGTIRVYDNGADQGLQ